VKFEVGIYLCSTHAQELDPEAKSVDIAAAKQCCQFVGCPKLALVGQVIVIEVS
jgi:hypothetical protein